MMLVKVVTDETIAGGVKAYYLTNVAQLTIESKTKALKNADSYAWFATAMYLDQCDWPRMISLRVPVLQLSLGDRTTKQPLICLLCERQIGVRYSPVYWQDCKVIGSKHDLVPRYGDHSQR